MGSIFSHHDGERLNFNDTIYYEDNVHTFNLRTVSHVNAAMLKQAPSVTLSEVQKKDVSNALYGGNFAVGTAGKAAIYVIAALICIAIGVYFTETCALMMGILTGGTIFVIACLIISSKCYSGNLHAAALHALKTGDYTAYLNTVENKKWGYDDLDYFYIIINGVMINVKENVYDSAKIGEKIITVFLNSDGKECLVLLPCPCYV